MTRLCFLITTAVAAFFIAGAQARDLRYACDSELKQHTERAGGGAHPYAIRMGGSIDGEMTRDPVGYWGYDQFWEPNAYVRIENIGDVPVVNPWLLKEGRPDTRSIKSIVDYVIKPGMSDAEKARRLWEFEIRQRFHATTSDEEVDDVVKRFNVYGYTLCGNESLIMNELWRAAGLKTRKGYPNGHSTTEVFYDGDWHLLDSDESIICLLRDNKTIASEAQIVADHDLMKRTHTYGPLHDDDPMRDESGAALHYYEGERTAQHPLRTKHTMDFVLRPGEAIAWAWNPGNRFHGGVYEGSHKNTRIWNERWRLIANVMNGEMTYSPDFKAESHRKYLDAQGLEFRASGPFGAGYYIAGKSGALTIPVRSAYPIVGGRLEADFARANTSKDYLRASISFDKGGTWKEVRTTFGSEYARTYIDLDPFFPATEPARYEYLMRLELASPAEQPVACIKGFYLKSTLQMARLAMPALTVGENRFTYTDQSEAGARVKITHAWRECDAAVPEAPAAAVYPPDGGVADGGRFRFRWQPASAGVPAADYQFELSEYPDMRWTLSPTFRRLIARTPDRGAAGFQIPRDGLLNPGQTYYWRVRARSDQGVWGPWSQVFSFQVDAPSVPGKIQARFDGKARNVLLTWERPSAGAPAVKYRIYGSAERGFTAHTQPYSYDAGKDGVRKAPPNLLLETAGPVTAVQLPPQLWRTWYRVSAVDAKGRESGASDLAELPHPLIASSNLPEGKCSTYYQAQLQVASSIGHLTSADENGRPYSMKFRAGDELRFEVQGAPEGLSIDSESGLIMGYLPAKSAGKYDLLVTVSSQNGSRDQVRLPLIVK